MLPERRRRSASGGSGRRGLRGTRGESPRGRERRGRARSGRSRRRRRRETRGGEPARARECRGERGGDARRQRCDAREAEPRELCERASGIAPHPDATRARTSTPVGSRPEPSLARRVYDAARVVVWPGKREKVHQADDRPNPLARRNSCSFGFWPVALTTVFSLTVFSCLHFALGTRPPRSAAGRSLGVRRHGRWRRRVRV